jgi:exodeoxyribonuclease-3
VTSERCNRASRVEESRVEEIRAHPAGLELELAESQHAELETKLNEIVTHRATLYCAPMRIVTLNVNGIRSAARRGFFEWIAKQDADVVCVQETRAQRDQIGDELYHPRGYHCYYLDAVRKGYSGVAIYSRRKPDRVVTGFGSREFDAEGRYIEAQFKDLSVVSAYLPSGSSSDERQRAKFRFLKQFMPHLRALKRRRRGYVICGDWNIAHKEIDLRNWRSNQKNSGFLPEERAWLDELFGDVSYIDAFRAVNQEPDHYTWWSNRGQAWSKNVGWRIDYHVLSPRLDGSVLAASIHKTTRFSDHAPLTIDYDL